MQWSEKYSVGVDYLDKQHKKIIEYINEAERMANAVDPAAPFDKEPLQRLLTALVDYTETHFREEEVMMTRHNVRNLQRHKEIHANLISQVKVLQQKFDSHGSAVLPILVKFLNEWLQTHILGIDKTYSTVIGAREAP